MKAPRCTGACNQGRAPCTCPTGLRPHIDTSGIVRFGQRLLPGQVVPIQPTITCYRTRAQRLRLVLADLVALLSSLRRRL